MPTPSTVTALRVPLLLVFAGLLAYSNSFHADFHLDDGPWMLDRDLLASFDTAVLSNTNRPFAAFTFWVNARFAGPGPYRFNQVPVWGGVSPVAFHVVNLAIHLLAGLTLFGIVRRTLRFPWAHGRFARSADAVAATVALLWLVHPLNTHAVTYLVQRCESLMGLLYLVTLYCLIRSRESEEARLWLQLSVLAALLGSATKEVMATAPAVLLVFDRVFLADGWRDVFRRRGLYYVALAVACWAIPVYVHFGASSQTDLAGAGVGFAGLIPAKYYLWTQATVLVHYLGLSVWPQQLTFEYRDWPVYARPDLVLPEGLCVVGLLAVTGLGIVRGRWYGAVGAWFFGILSITSSILPIIDVALEYRMYLPLISVVVLVVVAVRALLERCIPEEILRRRVAMGLVAVTALALGTRTFLRNLDYRSDFTLWERNLQTRPEGAKAYTHLGVACEEADRFDEAIAYHRQALARAHGGYLPVAESRLGCLLLWKGERAAADPYIERSQEFLDSAYYLALRELFDGRTDQALALLTTLEKTVPGRSPLLFTLAVVLDDVGRRDDSRTHVERGLRLFPEYARYAADKAQHRLQQPFFDTPFGRREALLLAREAALANGDAAAARALATLTPDDRDFRSKLADWLKTR